MAVREILLPWDQQPFGVASPSISGAAGLWLPGSANIATGGAASSGSGLSRGAGKYGQSDVLAGGGMSFGYFQELQSTQALTLVLVAEQTAAGSNRLFATNGLEMIPTFSGFDVYISGSRRFEVAVGYANAWSGCLVYAHDMSSSGNDPEAWLDGVQLTVTRLSTPGTPTLSGAAAICNHYNAPGTSRQFVGSVYGAGLLPGIAPNARELSQNPWQLFEPQQIWVPTASGAVAPNITAVYADSVTTSSVTPRVTLDFA